MDTMEAFLAVYAVGGLICGLTWFFGRRLIRRSRFWRAAFCALLSATIAPTAFYFWSGWVVWPAALMLCVVFDGGKNGLLALFYGAVPILIIAACLFSAWSLIIHRSQSDESQRV